MLRSLIAFGLVSLASGRAFAVTESGEPLPNGAMLTWPHLYIIDSNGDEVEPPDPETMRQRLNLASCVCSRAGATKTDLVYEFQLNGTTNTAAPADIFVGTECDNDELRPLQCRKLPDLAFSDLDALQQRVDTRRVPLFDIINATDAQSQEACREAESNALVWLAADANQDSSPEFFSAAPLHLDLFPNDVNGFDTKPPPLPDNIRASGGENSIEITWDIPTSNASDLYAYQAFCMDADGAAISSGAAPLFSTTGSVCDMPLEAALTPTEITGMTPVPEPPLEFRTLESGFICGTQELGTATSMKISGLTNGAEYRVAFIAIDRYGNSTGTFFTSTVVPQPVTDFWEDIHDRGGKVEGGFCSTGGGDALPGLLLPLGLVWVLRRRKKLASLALLGGLFAMPQVARADDFTPYWEDPANTTESGAGIYEDHVKWHVGIKLGPYTPAIDKQLGANATTGLGPYAAMFGNFYTDDDADGTFEAHDKHVYQILPMLDVERVLWSGSGQFAVGGTLGYMQKTAFAYRDDTTADDLTRLRTRASSNKFRMIPFALTASYRATQLDDLWGIPVVPYLRGGLAYYVWWMKGPSGSLSKICTDGTMDSDCEGNKAYGGTLGLQGTLGLSIRAERIDRDAARSMRNSGIYHAGFYAELMTAVVNGFGSDKKLSVGDNTWFAGFDFEF